MNKQEDRDIGALQGGLSLHIRIYVKRRKPQKFSRLAFLFCFPFMPK